MYCSKCAKEHEDGAKFCTSCGASMNANKQKEKSVNQIKTTRDPKEAGLSSFTVTGNHLHPESSSEKIKKAENHVEPTKMNINEEKPKSKSQLGWVLFSILIACILCLIILGFFKILGNQGAQQIQNDVFFTGQEMAIAQEEHKDRLIDIHSQLTNARSKLIYGDKTGAGHIYNDLIKVIKELEDDKLTTVTEIKPLKEELQSLYNDLYNINENEEGNNIDELKDTWGYYLPENNLFKAYFPGEVEYKVNRYFVDKEMRDVHTYKSFDENDSLYGLILGYELPHGAGFFEELDNLFNSLDLEFSFEDIDDSEETLFKGYRAIDILMNCKNQKDVQLQGKFIITEDYFYLVYSIYKANDLNMSIYTEFINSFEVYKNLNKKNVWRTEENGEFSAVFPGTIKRISPPLLDDRWGEKQIWITHYEAVGENNIVYNISMYHYFMEELNAFELNSLKEKAFSKWGNNYYSLDLRQDIIFDGYLANDFLLIPYLEGSTRVKGRIVFETVDVIDKIFSISVKYDKDNDFDLDSYNKFIEGFKITLKNQ